MNITFDKITDDITADPDIIFKGLQFRLKKFDFDNYNPENSDIKLMYKVNGRNYPIDQTIFNSTQLVNLGRHNDHFLGDKENQQIYFNYLQQLSQQQ
jgi:hypothetical protein